MICKYNNTKSEIYQIILYKMSILRIVVNNLIKDEERSYVLC